MKKTILALTILTMGACSTDLTPEAQLVRQITPEMTQACQFLGPVTGSEQFGLSVAEDASSALNKLRNETADRGGNAFVLTNSTSNYDSSIVQGDAYSC